MNDAETKLAARLGQAIRAHRTRLQLSQAELAETLEASPEFVSLLERGERLPALGTLARIGQALGVSPGALLDSDDSGTPKQDADPVLSLLRQLPKTARPAAIGMLRAMIAEYRRKQSKRRRG